MHPAYSIIVFTVLSGTGYGMVATVALADLANFLPRHAAGATAFVVGLGLIGIGLASSTLHLGHPERAWRALSQWRSSWLSREGVLALVTFVPLVIYGYGLIVQGEDNLPIALLVIAGAGATTYCTAMIYASLAPIPNWSNRLVPPGFLLLGIAGGAVCTLGVVSIFGPAPVSLALFALITCICAWLVKWRYWQSIDASALPANAAEATGLAAFGQIRSLAWPHTEENYLLREMGYRVARKHTAKLRLVALTTGGVVPIGLILMATLAPWSVVGAFVLIVAAIAVVAGVLIERWLFFAEAKHTVSLYYGV